MGFLLLILQQASMMIIHAAKLGVITCHAQAAAVEDAQRQRFQGRLVDPVSPGAEAHENMRGLPAFPEVLPYQRRSHKDGIGNGDDVA